MPKSRPKSPRPSSGSRGATLARALAPEELRAGEFVAVLHAVSEWPSWFWDGDAALLPAERPVRIARTPDAPGVPLEVVAACLPFVLVEYPCGKQLSLDVRTSRLARLDRGYARAARRAWKRAARESRSTRKSGC